MCNAEGSGSNVAYQHASDACRGFKCGVCMATGVDTIYQCSDNNLALGLAEHFFYTHYDSIRQVSSADDSSSLCVNVLRCVCCAYIGVPRNPAHVTADDPVRRELCRFGTCLPKPDGRRCL
jgi:hypothetical protein